MPTTLSTPLQVARLALWGDKAWLWYAAIARKAGGYYRIVRDLKHRTAGGVKWQACPFTLEVPPSTIESRLGGVDIVLPNIGRVPGALIELNRELLGSELVVYACLQGEDPADGLVFSQVVTHAKVSEKTVALSCSDTAAMRKVPQKAFTRENWPALAPVGMSWNGGRR